MKRLYIIMCICALAASASGQGLVKEVEGIRDFDPDKRPATRLTSTPRLLTPKIDATRLRFASDPVIVATESSITPVPLMANPLPSQGISSPGYAALGYFPKGDIGVSAGYRLIDRITTRLDAWGQLNRNQYDGQRPGYDEKWRMTTTDAAAGVNFAWRPTFDKTLRTSASYDYSHFNYPGGILVPASQSVNAGRLNASWESRMERWSYRVAASALYMGYSDAAFPYGYTVEEERTCPLSEISGGISATGRYQINKKVDVSLAVSYSGADLNRQYKNLPGTLDIYSTHGISKGVLSITPAVGFTGKKMTGHVGFNLATATGDASGTNLSFDMGWNWNLSPYFALNAYYKSGPELNALDRLYQVNRYGVPLAGVGVSYIPADVELSLNLLSFHGFTMKVGCGIASASDWVTPALTNGISTLAMTDLFTWRYTASAGYRYGNTVEAEVSLEGCMSTDYDEGYFRWEDRAARVARAAILYRPVGSVTIKVGYEYRADRKILSLNTLPGEDGTPLGITYEMLPLGDVSNLSIGAHWQINRTAGIFARVEGLTQGRYLQASGMPGQRLRPLAGVILTF